MRTRFYVVLLALAACRQETPAVDAQDNVGVAENAYTAPECPPEVDAAIRGAVKKYGLPRWFYYAVAHRESSFNPLAFNSTDGGQGLTQMTGVWYNGTPYPQNLAAPNENDTGWKNNMRIEGFKTLVPSLYPWIKMAEVAPLQPNDWKDPVKNLDRYSTGYAVPMYKLLRARYPSEPILTTFRRLAFHWRYGVYQDDYPNDPAGYFPGQYGYDNYIATYRPPVEAEDGVWTGLTTATPSAPVTYEAETMTHSVGGTISGGWYLWSDGYIATNHSFTAGSTTITVTARGEQAANVWPHMVVSVGGTAIGNATVNSGSYASYAFTFTATAGTKEIRVAFDNDYYDSATGADRNLIVDKLVVSGGSAPAISVSVTPATASIAAGATQQLTANVAVTWKVDEASGCGSVSASGLYTAGATSATCHVRATSTADTTKSAVSTITVTAPVTIAISPASASILTTATQQFTATVGGTTNTAVSWKIDEVSGCGAVSASGLYTPPSTAAACHVRATSAADTSKSAVATITVTSPPVSTCTATTYEAESITHSDGGAATGGWNLWSDGYLATNHPFAAVSTTITVQARGESAAGVAPHMVVSVGGVSIGSANVSATSYTAYNFTFTATAGTKEIRVTFDNDFYDTATGADRNLVVDKLSVSCSGATTPPPASGSKPTSPIAFTKNTVFTNNSGTTNWIYVPNAYDSTHNTPMTLFVWLHGCGGYSANDVEMVSGYNTNWISLTVGGREGGCWNVANDATLVMNAIAKIKTQFNIKPKSVIVGGYSSGGELAYRTAFHNANTFAGVLAENTQPFTTESSAAAIGASAWKFNIVHLAHTQDNTFLINNVKADVNTLKNAGFPVTLVERQGNHWDDAGALPGTAADLQTYLLPRLNDGWQSP